MRFLLGHGDDRDEAADVLERVASSAISTLNAYWTPSSNSAQIREVGRQHLGRANGTLAKDAAAPCGSSTDSPSPTA